MNTPANRFASSRSRGTIYVLTIGLALLVAVATVGALTTARVRTRTISDASDWEDAGMLAFSAVEQAISALNTAATAAPGSWRSAYTSRQIAYQAALGRGSMSWEVVDSDGSFANDYSQSFTLYGIGRVGSTTRVFSVQMCAAGHGLDVLKTACHGATAVTIGGTISAVGGAVSTNGLITLNAAVNGNVEAGSKTGSGTVSGTTTVPAPAKAMPPASVFDDYRSRATALPATAIDSFGRMQPYLLTNAYTPYAGVTPNPDGLYYIRIPSGISTVQLLPSRIKGTLLIEGSGTQQFQTNGEICWEPQRGDCPILVIKGCSTVQLNASISRLSESTVGQNLNPSGSPYNGTTNSTLTDTYPSEFDGLIHIVGAATVSLTNTFYLKGALITDGTIQTSGTTAIVFDPNLYNSPPVGYCKGDQILPTPGTWKWDSLP
jgi:hypothetical protein